MTQALPRPIEFAEFLDWKPEGQSYELHEGLIVEMQPTGKHEEITGFLATELTLEYRRLKLPYFIPKTALIKPTGKQSGYSPDVLILNRSVLNQEELWEQYSTVRLAESIPLVVEVVLKYTASHISTNWRDDYLTKLRDYEEIGIPEYWIVDYLALGGRRYIGNPKQPTISIYQLVDGEYQISQFKNSDRISSSVFSDLNLTAQQVFQALG